jgi:Zn-dependent protease with chaperone function
MSFKTFETEFLNSAAKAFTDAYRAGDSSAREIVRSAWEQYREYHADREEYRRRYGRYPVRIALD